MREASLKYIAANRKHCRAGAPPANYASSQAMRLALQTQSRKQITQRIFRPIQPKHRQARCGRRFPIPFRVIPDVKDLVRFQMHHRNCAMKNLRIGFVHAEFAGNEDITEIFGNAQMLQNESQTAIEVRDYCEFKLCS